MYGPGLGVGAAGSLPPLPQPFWVDRYPSVACEILTSDVPQINDALGADESLLHRLYGFLQSSGSLNPLLASFFSKVMGVLINRKTDQVPGPRAGRAGERGLVGPGVQRSPAARILSSCPSCGRRTTSWTCCCSTSAPRPSWTCCCASSPAWNGRS